MDCWSSVNYNRVVMGFLNGWCIGDGWCIGECIGHIIPICLESREFASVYDLSSKEPICKHQDFGLAL